MGFFAILLLSLLIVGDNLTNKPQDSQIETKKIEVIANKPIEKKPSIKEITPEPVKEEITPEPVKEEITPEPVKEEITPEPVKEEITPEPVKEEITPEPVKEEVKELDSLDDSGTNYLSLVLYIIGGILIALTGMYFFLRKQNSTPANIQPKTTEPPPPVEEEVQPETTEPPQPVEEEVQPETTEPPQPVEEEVQPETTEPNQTEEDKNNNK